MANDNHASYARIGFAVFIGIVAILGTLIYLGGVRGRDIELLVETCYDKPVSGLSVGSVVNFRGVKIGEVREIAFVGNKYDVKGADNSRIYILMAINRQLIGAMEINDDESAKRVVSDFVKRLGLRATVTASGITGLSRIEWDFNLDKNLAPMTDISWTPKHAFIPPKVSLLDSFSDSATKVMNQLNTIDINAVWSNVNNSVQSLARVTDSIKLMVETRQNDLEKLFEGFTSTSESIRALMSELRQNPSLLIRERRYSPLPETER